MAFKVGDKVKLSGEVYSRHCTDDGSYSYWIISHSLDKMGNRRAKNVEGEMLVADDNRAILTRNAELKARLEKHEAKIAALSVENEMFKKVPLTADLAVLDELATENKKLKADADRAEATAKLNQELFSKNVELVKRNAELVKENVHLKIVVQSGDDTIDALTLRNKDVFERRLEIIAENVKLRNQQRHLEEILERHGVSVHKDGRYSFSLDAYLNRPHGKRESDAK